MPPRERRPPRWTADFVTENPMKETVQLRTGSTRSDKRVNSPPWHDLDDSPTSISVAISNSLSDGGTDWVAHYDSPMGQQAHG